MEGFYFYANESKEELAYALDSLSSYVPVSAIDLFFESEDDGIAVTSKENENSILAHLKKAIKAIKEMISKVFNSVTTAMQTLFMSKDEKNRFMQFREAMKANPEFANKKITVKSFREVDKLFKTAIDEIDRSVNEIQNSNEKRAGEIEQACKETVNKIFTDIKNTAAVVMTKDAALRMCEGNREVAKRISRMLDGENKAVQMIEKELGEERAADFKKKVDSCTKRLSLHRLKVMILGQWHRGATKTIEQVLTDIKDVISLKPTKLAKQTNIIDDVIGSVNTKTGSELTKTKLVKGARAIKKEVRDAEKAKDDIMKYAEKRAKKAKKEAKKSGESLKKFLTS